MAITTAEIIEERPFGGNLKLYLHFADSLANDYNQVSVVHSSFTAQDRIDLLATKTAALDNALAQQEIADAISTYYAGGDPLHVEVSAGNWQKITPNFQTWFELAKAVTIHFLQQSSKLELANIHTIITRISSQDKASLWDVNVPTVSSINADIQTAFDTQTTLDLYTPRADSEGVVS